MRRLSTTAVAGGLLAAMLVSLSAWAVYVNAARGEEVAQDGATDGLPSSPPAIYQKLQKRVGVNFQQIKLADTLRSLEKSLGAPVQLDRTDVPAELLDRPVNVQVDEPVTIKLALHLVLQYAGLPDRQITFEDDGVRLVGPEAATGRHVLRTHDLRGASNYSTALRRTFIDRVRHEVAADTWGRDDQAWIHPAASVFGIDVYQSAQVHQQLDELWQRDYVSQDNVRFLFDRRELAVGNLGKEKSPEEFKALAAKLRRTYPLESLGPRLKYETAAAPSAKPPLSPAAAARLTQLEKQAQLMKKSAWMELRTKSLEQLHSDEVAKFVSREGFGFSRMPQPGPTFLPLPAPPELALPSAEVEPPAYEAPSRNSQRNAASSIAAVRMPSPDKLNLFHVASEGSFLSPQRLGYVQDRDHVAGFGGHAFMSLPRLEDQAGWGTEPTEQWAIRRLELVSILKHKTPRVYVADELPNMEKLADAPTRALGDFERPALAKLAAGEDVVTHATINRIEMLGALRAHKQCMECHDVERGQLLGAFSYTLLRDPPAPETIGAH